MRPRAPLPLPSSNRNPGRLSSITLPHSPPSHFLGRCQLPPFFARLDFFHCRHPFKLKPASQAPALAPSPAFRAHPHASAPLRLTPPPHPPRPAHDSCPTQHTVHRRLLWPPSSLQLSTVTPFRRPQQPSRPAPAHAASPPLPARIKRPPWQPPTGAHAPQQMPTTAPATRAAAPQNIPERRRRPASAALVYLWASSVCLRCNAQRQAHSGFQACPCHPSALPRACAPTPLV